MNVLSLFDGISCGQVALHRAGIRIDTYYASEIDKNAIRVTQVNFPSTIQLGDVRNLTKEMIKKDIDLMTFGSPCTNLSFSGKRNGMITKEKIKVITLEQYLSLKKSGFAFEGQSYLFWEAVRLLLDIKPKYFLMENVVMQKEWEKIITETLGVEPIQINSALVSAQNRVRLYWTNIPNVTQPEDKQIKLTDILETTEYIGPGAIRGRNIPLNKATILGRRINEDGHRQDYNKSIPIIQCLEVRDTNRDKSNCLTTVEKDNVLTPLPIGRHLDAFGKYSGKRLPYRNYTRLEYERLQTLPEGYTNCISESAAKRAIGNGWTVDVIAHILSCIPKGDR